jgi:hypothetical protein
LAREAALRAAGAKPNTARYLAAMPARRVDTTRLLAAVDAQRAANGEPAWSGPDTAAALGAACVAAVLVAVEGGGTPEREALRGGVMYSLGQLASGVPGRAVEVRVPPYAAIQCVPGPRHTRGTPPNVVETDPVTWILLATGRLPWAEAVTDGRVRASGPRADISGYLPLSD